MTAVGFDFDHTLGIDNKLERTIALELLREVAAERGVPLDEATALEAVEHTLMLYRSGKVTFEVAWGGVATLLLGPNVDTVTFVGEFSERCVEAAPRFVEPLPHAKEMLEALAAAHIPIALLTNGWSPLQEMKAQLIGFSGPVFVSERIGARKPSMESFAYLRRHFEEPPAKIWYVGDDPYADVAGALGAGMVAVWFDWEGHTYPSELPPPTHVIRGLDELVPLVQGSAALKANPT